MTSLTLERLSVSYGSRQALCDVDLTVRSGECVLLAGASGSGKSTLLHCLNRLIPQCLPGEVTGRVLLDERPIDGATVAELSRIVGVVFQNPRTQLLNVRVEDEVAFGPRNLGLDDDEVERRVAWALDAVGLSALRPRTTHALSGGERQRLAIAAVLAMGPRLLVLDEPMANLDVDRHARRRRHRSQAEQGRGRHRHHRGAPARPGRGHRRADRRARHGRGGRRRPH